VVAVHDILEDGRACLPPVVLTELLSDPKLPKRVAELVQQLPVLEPKSGYWVRAGTLRAKAIARKRKARLADTLILGGHPKAAIRRHLKSGHRA
jgi:hypothetical protein